MVKLTSKQITIVVWFSQKRFKKQHIAKNENLAKLKDAHTKNKNKQHSLCTSRTAEKEKGVILIQFAIKALARPFIFSLKARLKGQFN